ncbi:MAG TPA: ATP-binding protein [Solirubrobacteraceae bacterium]
MSRSLGLLLSVSPPPRRVGLLVALIAVALCTLIVYPLGHLAPVVSLAVVYIPAVLVVSVIWSGWLGALTAALSALAFNFFHLPPVDSLTLKDSENWVALAAFVVAAIITSSVAEITRERARDALERRREADLATELARLLLGGAGLGQELPTAAARIAQALQLPSAAIVTDTVVPDERGVAFALREGDKRLGTLVVGADTPERSLHRLQERMVPVLETLMSAASERETLQGEVVETASLRRADVVKTALLRAVSHDLRSPLTAISAAGEAIASPSLTAEEHAELSAVIVEEAGRLSRLVENLLDLSRLQAGAAEPRRDWSSVEEVIGAALSELGATPQEFGLSIDSDLPLVSFDPVQMERAFVNVLENARRHRGGYPVSIRAREVNGRVIVRIVDRGPGIPPAQLERVFEPFYRAGRPDGASRGSGLGLAIARGFTEANGGRLSAESLPGQGATFVFELPLRSPASTAPPRGDQAPVGSGPLG